MSSNSNLSNAKINKNDEFYTQYEDIEKELINYTDKFKNKVVYCNCDNPKYSNFWLYFKNNFKELGLKKLISTYIEFDKDKKTYKTEYDGAVETRVELKSNGDFRSEECINVLKESDIICTNPPFSLFREFVKLIMEYNKQLLVIGSLNAITYKEIFPLIKDNKLWLGYKKPKNFNQPNNTIKTFGNILWYTNLDINKRYKKLELIKEYNEADYPKYDNYNAINIGKTKDIPYDYKGVMGVPITFLDKYNPNQFEIIGFLGDNCRNDCECLIGGKPTYVDEHHKKI